MFYFQPIYWSFPIIYIFVSQCLKKFNYDKTLRIPHFLFSAFPIYAQFSNTINFVHIGLEQGLSQSTILDIVQDDRGNMWFATYDGLNKYDGYTFTVYQHNENHTASISGDIIRTLKIDSQKRLWAGHQTHRRLPPPTTEGLPEGSMPEAVPLQRRAPGHRSSAFYVQSY